MFSIDADRVRLLELLYHVSLHGLSFTLKVGEFLPFPLASSHSASFMLYLLDLRTSFRYGLNKNLKRMI